MQVALLAVVKVDAAGVVERALLGTDDGLIRTPGVPLIGVADAVARGDSQTLYHSADRTSGHSAATIGLAFAL